MQLTFSWPSSQYKAFWLEAKNENHSCDLVRLLVGATSILIANTNGNLQDVAVRELGQENLLSASFCVCSSSKLLNKQIYVAAWSDVSSLLCGTW